VVSIRSTGGEIPQQTQRLLWLGVVSCQARHCTISYDKVAADTTKSWAGLGDSEPVAFESASGQVTLFGNGLVNAAMGSNAARLANPSKPLCTGTSDSLIVLLIPAAPNDSPQSRPVLGPPLAPPSPRFR
jgi:hypothetical protein